MLPRTFCILCIAGILTGIHDSSNDIGNADTADLSLKSSDDEGEDCDDEEDADDVTLITNKAKQPEFKSAADALAHNPNSKSETPVGVKIKKTLTFVGIFRDPHKGEWSANRRGTRQLLVNLEQIQTYLEVFHNSQILPDCMRETNGGPGATTMFANSTPYESIFLGTAVPYQYRHIVVIMGIKYN